MRNNIIRGALLGILLLGFAIPGTALAGGGGKGCSNIGTWFGVMAPGDTTPTGWMATVTGKSNNEGTNNLEYPNFKDLDLIFGPTRLSSMRGTWKRTGGNTFDYSFTGYGVDTNKDIVYIVTVSGVVTLIEDCRYQETTAVMDIFLPGRDPFQDDPDMSIPLSQEGPLYGYRMMPGN